MMTLWAHNYQNYLAQIKSQLYLHLVEWKIVTSDIILDDKDLRKEEK